MDTQIDHTFLDGINERKEKGSVKVEINPFHKNKIYSILKIDLSKHEFFSKLVCLSLWGLHSSDTNFGAVDLTLQIFKTTKTYYSENVGSLEINKINQWEKYEFELDLSNAQEIYIWIYINRAIFLNEKIIFYLDDISEKSGHCIFSMGNTDCSFNAGLCGWRNYTGIPLFLGDDNTNNSFWIRENFPTSRPFTPKTDATHKIWHLSPENIIGFSLNLVVNTSKGHISTKALISPVIPGDDSKETHCLIFKYYCIFAQITQIAPKRTLNIIELEYCGISIAINKISCKEFNILNYPVEWERTIIDLPLCIKMTRLKIIPNIPINFGYFDLGLDDLQFIRGKCPTEKIIEEEVIFASKIPGLKILLPEETIEDVNSDKLIIWISLFVTTLIIFVLFVFIRKPRLFGKRLWNRCRKFNIMLLEYCCENICRKIANHFLRKDENLGVEPLVISLKSASSLEGEENFTL